LALGELPRGLENDHLHDPIADIRRERSSIAIATVEILPTRAPRRQNVHQQSPPRFGALVGATKRGSGQTANVEINWHPPLAARAGIEFEVAWWLHSLKAKP
jgi:hypothetical protein